MTALPAIPRQCFAASNSAEGFRNYYGEIFTDDHIDRLYIVKGGPGTGKSHFMRAVARYARGRGYDAIEFYCSSDPASLDGLLLTKEGESTVGLLDGTPPHVREPSVPGAKDELVNLGEFWDPLRLAGQRDTIAALGRSKAAAYARAYACLRGAGEMEALAESLVSPCIHRDRIGGLAARILRGHPEGQGFAAIPALRGALSMAGKHTLHSFETAASSLILPEEYYGVGFALTVALLEESRARGLRVYVSYDPLCPKRVDGLLYPDTGLCILLRDTSPPEGIPVRVLPLRRYGDAEALRLVRGELRRTLALREELVEAALRHLSKASEAHFELEKIYSAAMDFSAKEAFTERFCRRVLG